MVSSAESIESLSGRDHPSRWHGLVSVVAGCYLVVQLVLPMLIMLRPGPFSRDFSWDMFSHSLSCSKVDAIVKSPGGTTGSARLDLDFSGFAQLVRVMLPGRLEAYGASLCAKLRAETGHPVELYFIMQCRDDRDAPTHALVDPAHNYCAEQP